MARAAAFRRGPFPARGEQGPGGRSGGGMREEKSRMRFGTAPEHFRPVFAGVSTRSWADAPEKSGISLSCRAGADLVGFAP